MLGLVKLYVGFYVKKYQGLGFRALKREDARQRFIGVPSEYGRVMKPVFPPGMGTRSAYFSAGPPSIIFGHLFPPPSTQLNDAALGGRAGPLIIIHPYDTGVKANGNSKPFSGWVGENLWHYVETFSLLIGDGTFSYNDGEDGDRVSLHDMSLLPAMQLTWQRLQGACTILRLSQYRVNASEGQDRIDHNNQQIDIRLKRINADITMVGRMFETHSPSDIMRYILHIAACEVTKLLTIRGWTLPEGWMEQLQGNMKGCV